MGSGPARGSQLGHAIMGAAGAAAARRVEDQQTHAFQAASPAAGAACQQACVCNATSSKPAPPLTSHKHAYGASSALAACQNCVAQRGPPTADLQAVLAAVGDAVARLGRQSADWVRGGSG